MKIELTTKQDFLAKELSTLENRVDTMWPHDPVEAADFIRVLMNDYGVDQFLESCRIEAAKIKQENDDF